MFYGPIHLLTYLMADKQSSNCIFSLFFRNISETMEVKDQVSLIAIGKKHTFKKYD